VNYLRRLTRKLLHQPQWYEFWKQASYRRRLLMVRFILTVLAFVGLASALAAVKIGLYLKDQAQTQVKHPFLVEFIYNIETQTVKVNRSTILPRLKPEKLTRQHSHRLKLSSKNQPDQEIAFSWITQIHAEKCYLTRRNQR
jgi:hypothetical protein